MERLDEVAAGGGPQRVPVTPRQAPAVVARSSVERGRGPSPGVYEAPFHWRDVVEAPPPRRRARGEGAYVTYHDTETDSDTRITYSTVITVDPGENPDDPNDDILVLETHVGVQSRFLLEFIHWERRTMDARASRWRQRVTSLTSRQRRVARRLGAGWMRRSAMWLIRTEGRLMLATIRGVRGASRSVAELPDRIYTRIASAAGHLSNRLSRRVLLQGLKDPQRLSGPEKRVVFTVSTLALVTTVFLVNNLVSVAAPGYAGAWAALLKAYLLGVATALLLPFPPSELLTIEPFLVAGPVVAFLTLVLSKMTGAWLIFFIGDALHALIEEQTDGRPRLAAVVSWMNRNSAKYGALILAIFMAAPFLPDTLALYVFAVSGMSFRGYMAGALTGTVLRYAAVVGILMFFGTERIHELFG